jgi:signal transduction histidine kinase
VTVTLPRVLRWDSYRVRTKGLIVVGLPVLPLAVFWLILGITVLRQDRPANTTGRSLLVQAGLARVFSDVLDADAAARHALFTGSVKANRRYRAAIDRLAGDMAGLERAVIDPDLRQSLAQLQKVVEDELIVLGRLTGTVPAGAPPLGELEALDRSVENLDEIRDISASLETRQRNLTAARSERERRSQRVLFYGFLIGSIVCALGGVIAAVVVASGISRRAGALARNADRLAHGLPPEPLPVGEDEIAMVDERLRKAAQLLGRREDELLERTADLEAANRELEAFSYSVSHDLRAPLRAIDGFSEVIERESADKLDATGQDALRRVRAAAGRMGMIIDELLNLSRLNRVDVTRRRVDISGSASAILTDLARRHPERRVAVTIEANLVAEADPDLLEIALHNLLDNAWKYTSKTPDARIDVHASQNGGARVFHIRDNGAGFDMARAHKLFGAFQRLHVARDFEGTGIGLATVQRIVRRHGGRIWAESAVDAGATFSFTLEPEARARS